MNSLQRPQMGRARKFAFLLILMGVVALNAANPHYFQQKVNYRLHARLIPSLGRIEGRAQMSYLNCSPDTLGELYFHLYLNRFRKFSGARLGYQEIIQISQTNGGALNWEVDRTLLRVKLPDSLLPGDSIQLQIQFNSVLPASADRLGVFGDHLDVGNWYPVPVVYNSEGWQLSQHYEGEFFQEWGNYLVEIEAPADFQIASTGVLVKENWNSADTTVGNPPTRIQTFSAKNVHDFAFSADPNFRLKTFDAGNTRLNFWILPEREKDWETLYPKVLEAFRILNRQIGVYPYPELDIVDSAIRAGGMEYPGLVMINQYINRQDDLLATVIHEIAHQWFYGLLANNQTLYGWMDEGWTTFWENWVYSQVAADSVYVESPPGFWGKYYGYWEDRRQEDWKRAREYVREENEPVNRPFDWYLKDPYLPTYQKASVVFSQLQYVMGDSLFFAAVRYYFQQWRFKHPSPPDMITCFETVYGGPLNWFFEQWLNTNWHCDYRVTKVEQEEIGPSASRPVIARISLERLGEIQMPLDIRMQLENDSVITRRIYTGAQAFVTGIEDNCIWPFKQKRFQYKISLPSKIRKVDLNPEGKLFDVNPLNDRQRFFPPLRFYWLHRQYIAPPLDSYAVSLMPDIFYDDYSGAQLGVKWIGYFSGNHPAFRGNLRVGHRLKGPIFRWETTWPVSGSATNLQLFLGINAGLLQTKTGLQKVWRWKREWEGELQAMWYFRERLSEESLLLPLPSRKVNNFLFRTKISRWGIGYRPPGGELVLRFTRQLPFAAEQYEQLTAGAKFRFNFFCNTDLELQGLAGWNYGELPVELQYRPGGEIYENILQNPFFHYTGLISEKSWQNHHLFVSENGGISSLAGSSPVKVNRYFNGSLEWRLPSPLQYVATFIPYFSEAEPALFAHWSAFQESAGYFHYGEAGIALTFSRLPFLFNYFDIEEASFHFPLLFSATGVKPEWEWRWNINFRFLPFE
ncbi:MAG: hypothetical protein Kow0037_06840 [Calditrichia bacterium]